MPNYRSHTGSSEATNASSCKVYLLTHPKEKSHVPCPKSKVRGKLESLMAAGAGEAAVGRGPASLQDGGILFGRFQPQRGWLISGVASRRRAGRAMGPTSGCARRFAATARLRRTSELFASIFMEQFQAYTPSGQRQTKISPSASLKIPCIPCISW